MSTNNYALAYHGLETNAVMEDNVIEYTNAHLDILVFAVKLSQYFHNIIKCITLQQNINLLY